MTRRRTGFMSYLRPALALLFVRIALGTASTTLQVFCLVGLVVALAPWLVARLVAIPLGLGWLAGWLAWLADDLWAGDAAGGRLLAEAWTILRSGRGGPIEARLGSPLGAAGIVGAGLATAVNGDRDGARRLFASIDVLPSGTVPIRAAHLAWRWRMADALERGDWAEAVALAPRLGRRGRFFELAARRLGGLGDVTDEDLRRLGWRQADRSLLEMALAGRAPRQRVSVETATWEAALDRAALWARERAGALALPDAEAVVASFTAAVENDLAERALAAGTPVPDGPGLVGRVHRRVRDKLLSDVEAASRSLGARVAEGRELPALLEWTELLSLRALVARAAAVGGLEVRRLAFPDVHGAVCPLTCRLWNGRQEHLLAAALFRWLYDEALAVGDERLAVHERQNVELTR